jgi:peptide-methionine (S)-S-oxide reductase
VVRTEVGYCGGTTPDPTYRNIGDHAEAVQLHFDPERVTFDELLALFWSGHDPTHAKGSQYRAGLFCHGDAQMDAARRSAAKLQDELGAPVLTQIARDVPWYPAEAYHQKWRLRQRKAAFEALLARYPDEPSMLASTLAAKANAHAGGHLDAEWLVRELPQLQSA